MVSLNRGQSLISSILMVGVALAACWASIASAVEAEFPGREIYPEVKHISMEQLYARRNDVVIVDVRSSYEYSTLRIENAVNISLADADFSEQMTALRKRDPRQIIVYCNGKTCMKSYKAARKCQLDGIEDVLAYDAGVLDWAQQYPDATLLLDVKLNDPGKLISKAHFKQHSLSPDEFSERMAATNDIVLDVRDRFQREGLSIFVGREYRVYLDDSKKLDRYLNKAKSERKGLLIYDAAGKQVRWLQYYLESKGIKEYYFMDGGIHAYYQQIEKDL
ncbi:MAG: rhodanese-like domain-containing protein [Gammaproteobacteria bacterium]